MPPFTSASRAQSPITRECVLLLYSLVLTCICLGLVFVPAFQDIVTSFTRRHIASQRHDFIHALHRNSIQTQVLLLAASEVGLFDHLASLSDDSNANNRLSVSELASDLDLDFATLHVCVANLISMDLLDVHEARKLSQAGPASFGRDQLVSLSKISQTYLVSPEQRFVNAVSAMRRESAAKSMKGPTNNMFSFISQNGKDDNQKSTFMSRDALLRKQQQEQAISDLSLVDLVNGEHHSYVGNKFPAADGNNFGFLEKLYHPMSTISKSIKSQQDVLIQRLTNNNVKSWLSKKVSSHSDQNVLVNNFFSDATSSFDALQNMIARRLLSRTLESIDDFSNRFRQHQGEMRQPKLDNENKQNGLSASPSFMKILYVSTENSSPAFGSIVLDNIAHSNAVFYRHIENGNNNNYNNNSADDKMVSSILKYFSPNRATSILGRSRFISGNTLIEEECKNRKKNVEESEVEIEHLSSLLSVEENDDGHDNEKRNFPEVEHSKMHFGFELVLTSPNFFQNSFFFDPDKVVEVAATLLKFTKPGSAICMIETLKFHDKLPISAEKQDSFGHYFRSLELILKSSPSEEKEEEEPPNLKQGGPRKESGADVGKVYSSSVFKQLLLKAGWIRVELIKFAEPKTHTIIIARKALI